ncbi:MAG: hypothetical protein JHC87_06475, partial [Thermoleophilaceae bacterium]|nr:hypothetical protein [Thermoleophilaceae bacterium]
MPRSRFFTLALLSAATLCLAAAGEASARPVTVVTGTNAAAHSDVKVAIAGKTLKLQRVRRLNIDFPEGMMMNTRPFAASCTFRAFERGQCKVKQQVGLVTLAVAFG